MIDEHRQDLAAEYALDALDPESARAFEAMLANDAELKALADDLRETAAALALDAPAHLPPPELRERILSRIRAEAEAGAPAAPTATAVAPSTEAPVPSGGGRNLLPWALAAGFAITTAALWMERGSLQQDRTALLQEARELRNRDFLAKVKIATLSAQVDAYSKATAVIVWDAEKQHGVVKLNNVPPAGAGKDYQLWVIDPKYPAPVNGGLVPVNAEGIARVSFSPDQPISKADKFAISLEPAGGVPKATGPIVLLGGN
ncbi:MAG: anti-sigma factor [Chthoniobacter sp.]|uniref:anti-sigma factor n=1 Tax=Chthoniobacter sp. TaxID=2510640 RepID=UPI0032AA8F06